MCNSSELKHINFQARQEDCVLGENTTQQPELKSVKTIQGDLHAGKTDQRDLNDTQGKLHASKYGKVDLHPCHAGQCDFFGGKSDQSFYHANECSQDDLCESKSSQSNPCDYKSGICDLSAAMSQGDSMKDNIVTANIADPTKPKNYYENKNQSGQKGISDNEGNLQASKSGPGVLHTRTTGQMDLHTFSSGRRDLHASKSGQGDLHASKLGLSPIDAKNDQSPSLYEVSCLHGLFLTICNFIMCRLRKVKLLT